MRYWSSPILLILLMLPSTAQWLESTMTGQMLCQIPLLVVAGYGIGRNAAQKFPRIHLYIGGIPGLLLVVFTMFFWMIPRSLDASLVSPFMEGAKYVSLTLFAGIPLGVGWHKLGFIVKGFVWIHLISMVFFMGWLYAAAPVRVCNYYLIDQQKLTGWYLIGAGAGIVIYFFVMSIVKAFRYEDKQVKDELYTSANITKLGVLK